MKHILTSYLLFGLVIANAQSFSVSEPILVGSGFGYQHPQIEITNDEQPIVLWTGLTDKKLYVAKYDGIGAFSTPLAINPPNLNVQNYNWSGADLAIEDDNVYVVFRSEGYETGHVYVVKSTDNGLTFSDTVRVDELTTGFGQYPDIAVHQDTVWVTFMDHNATGVDPQYVVARSVDGGATFETEVATGSIIGDEACDCCQPEIIVNENYVIVYLRNNDNNIRDIKGVISYDRGATFSDWFSVDDHLWQINACPSTGPDSKFIDENTSLTVYKTSVNGSASVFLNEYNHATDNSTSLVKIYDSESDNILINYPQIATRNGVIGVVWEAKGSISGAGTDVFINSSSIGASGILAGNAFNLTNITGNQNKPDIALSSQKFHVVYADLGDGELKYVELQSLNSIENNEGTSTLSVYPNPVVNEINLESTTGDALNGDIIIHSLNGKEMHKATLSATQSTFTIDVANWPTGVYYLTHTSESNKAIYKIII